MPSFYLRFEDACGSLQKVAQQADEWDNLATSWRVFRKVAVHLDASVGNRCENLAKRLGHLQSSEHRRVNRRLDLARPVASVDVNKRHGRKNSLSKLWIQPIPKRKTDNFDRLDVVSLLGKEGPGKPTIQLSLDAFTKDISNKTTHDTTTHDIHDPNEIYILPSVLPPTPFSLHSIPELSDSEPTNNNVHRPTSPVYFTNPFGQPSSTNQPGQIPSPPQTPSLSEYIPPDLNDQEEKEEEDSSRLEPINLTGRIKKLMDPPIALGGTSDIFYGEWRLPVPKRVAVKVLRTTSTNSVATVQRRLRREMRLWWMCRHRNVVPLFGYASDFGGMDAMISPWMKNGSALAYIKTQKCSWSERLKLLGDVVAGLKYLHHFQPPIVHGDLKPTNVLVSDGGDACLCDFGLSRIIKCETGPSGFTTSNFAGSIRYMSPELLNSEDEEALPLVTTASDVYALGCVGLEIVTDHVPYANRNLDAQVMHDIIRGIPPARRPSLANGTPGKHSSKFWDLMVSTWAAEPTYRPDIVQIGRLLSECRTPHQGPQLRVEHTMSSMRSGRFESTIAQPSRALSRSSSSLGRGRIGSVFRVPMVVDAQEPPVAIRSVSAEPSPPRGLERFRRSTSVGLKLKKNREERVSFRPSLDAVEQVWHDE